MLTWVMWGIIQWEDFLCGFCEMSDEMSSLDYYAHSSECTLPPDRKEKALRMENTVICTHLLQSTCEHKGKVDVRWNVHALFSGCNGYHGSAPASVDLYLNNLAARRQAKACQAVYASHRYNLDLSTHWALLRNSTLPVCLFPANLVTDKMFCNNWPDRSAGMYKAFI